MHSSTLVDLLRSRIVLTFALVLAASTASAAVERQSTDAAALGQHAPAVLGKHQAAAEATAGNNPLCRQIQPFYWEIGSRNGPVTNGSEGANSDGSRVLATTAVPVASASKILYAAYVVQVRGGVDKLSSGDIDFLHFTSGYTNMSSAGVACPSSLSPDTVNECLTQYNSLGVLYGAQNPDYVGRFYYDGAHMEVHGSRMTGLGSVDVGSLANAMQAIFAGTELKYTQPLLAGGIYGTAKDFGTVLQHIVSGSLAMHDALGTNSVCTRRTQDCNAAQSPIPEAWHYSLGHWVEDDPATHGDGAFSSPGAMGFYPWIDAQKRFYGIISRSAPAASVSGEQQGYDSAQCGRLIRHAFMTGKEQTGALPQS